MDCKNIHIVQSFMKLVVILLVFLPLTSYSNTIKTNPLILPPNMFIYEHQSFAHIDNFISTYTNNIKRDSSELSNEIYQLKKWINEHEKENKRRTLTIELLIFSLLITVIYIIHIYSFNKRMKKSSKELKEKNALLNEQNVMKNNFISIISHDLRSPFNSIIGLSEILEEELREEDVNNEIKEYSSRLVSSSKKTLDLLDSILMWARSQMHYLSIHKEKFEVESLLGQLGELYSSSVHAKGIDLKICCESKYIIYTDRNIVETAVRNLLNNAIKFTPQGGCIELGCFLNDDSDIVIYVKDSGIGISETLQSKLLKGELISSNQGTNSERGSGLGLKISFELLRTLNANIKITSKEKKGSTFYLTFKNK